MLRKMFVFLFCLVIGSMLVGPAVGQVEVIEEWVARYDGLGDSTDSANAIAVDSSGNVYVTGYSWGSGTGHDYTTVKYDTNGNQLWDANYDNGPEDYAHAIAVDSSGNVYVTGVSWGIETSLDYATVSYDSSGGERWVARYNNGYSDTATAIAVDSSGNVYVTGASRGSGTYIDYATVSYDSSGGERWVARYDNGPEDYAHAIAVDSSGNVNVTGYSYGSGTHCDYATVSYDSSGKERWVARYDGPGNGNDSVNAIAVDSSRNIYVTGISSDDYATIKYSLFTPPPSNQPPVANAGEDETYLDVEIDNIEYVFLDGSGSYDPDGSIQSFVWTWEQNGILKEAIGENPMISLEVGTYVITLRVTDDLGAIGEDEITITIESNDVDGDGLRDDHEMGWFGTLEYGPGDDPDGDGLTIEQEILLGTHPNNADSDGDGLTDGDEVNVYGTNPLVSDSDVDGYSDKEEVDNGSNPNEAACLPEALAIERLKEIITSMDLDDTTKSGLISRLDNAQKHIENGNLTPAANMLNAFNNYVNAQKGKKKISVIQANQLEEAAGRIERSLRSETCHP